MPGACAPRAWSSPLALVLANVSCGLFAYCLELIYSLWCILLIAVNSFIGKYGYIYIVIFFEAKIFKYI